MIPGKREVTGTYYGKIPEYLEPLIVITEQNRYSDGNTESFFMMNGEPPAQKLHNKLLDLENESANRHNKMKEEIHQLRMKQWEEHRRTELEKNPDQWIPLSYPNMDVTAPKRVIGIRYIE